jgi:hypothetical protein
MIGHCRLGCMSFEEEIEVDYRSLSAVDGTNLLRCLEIDTLVVGEVARIDLQDGKCRFRGFDRTSYCSSLVEEVQEVEEVGATFCCCSLVATWSSTFSYCQLWSWLKKQN